VPFGPPNVDGVGPDAKHPFIIKNFKAYNTHWAIHPVSPSVLIENMDIQNSEYGVWRPVYNKHAYESINFVKVPENLHYAFEPAGRPKLGERKPLAPIDDLPPTTVITHVLRAGSVSDGKLLVRGVTADNGTVTKVLVNGAIAKATRPNFAEWEILIDRPRGAAGISAHAEDAAGNVEKRVHLVMWK
jgi:hypothetical protein